MIACPAIVLRCQPRLAQPRREPSTVLGGGVLGTAVAVHRGSRWWLTRRGSNGSKEQISNLSTVANFGCDDTGCTVEESLLDGTTVPLKEDWTSLGQFVAGIGASWYCPWSRIPIHDVRMPLEHLVVLLIGSLLYASLLFKTSQWEITKQFTVSSPCQSSFAQLIRDWLAEKSSASNTASQSTI